jgi:TRAP-type C4-dicarboxylate transport system permease small subunit
MSTAKSACTGGATARPASLWSRVDKGFEIGSRAVELILTAAFIFAVVLNFATAADRYIFKHSIIGSDEIQTFIMIWMTFVGAAAASWRHQHLRMDVITARLPRRVRVALFGIELVLILGLMTVLAKESFTYAAQMQRLDRRSDLAGLPMWLPHSAIFVGFGLIALVTLWRIVELFASRTKPENHPTKAAL